MYPGKMSYNCAGLVDVDLCMCNLNVVIISCIQDLGRFRGKIKHVYNNQLDKTCGYYKTKQNFFGPIQIYHIKFGEDKINEICGRNSENAVHKNINWQEI